MRSLSFRQKIVLLAVALVAVIQLGTLVPVLNALKQDAEAQARRAVRLAGIVFDEFMVNRTAQLSTTADAVAADFAFREAVAIGDPEAVLANHAARAGASIAVVLDLDGNIIAGTGTRVRTRGIDAVPPLAFGSDLDGAYHAVTIINDTPYQTVTVPVHAPVRAPVTIAWVTFGFSIDRRLAIDIENLTGLHATFVRFGVEHVETFASTLPDEEREAAVAGIHLGNSGTTNRGFGDTEYLTSLRPFLDEPNGLYVALQSSLREATAAYRNIRNILLLITGSSLLLAIGGAFWVARMVTRPVQDLAAAARRMGEGVYTQALAVASSDELGELAAGFNSMQEAIADRERRIFHIAHHDSLSGLPTRDLVVSRLREKIGEVAQLTVVNLALSRFDGIVCSLGHRTGDDLIKLVAGVLRNMTQEEHQLGHLNHHEFVIVLPGYGIEQAKQFVCWLSDTLRAGVVVKGANISLQARAGLAAFPQHGTDAAELLRCAAIARNDAQQGHEPIVEYRLGQQDRAMELIRIVGDFPRALKNNELDVLFQPKIDCDTRAVVGAEALVRWQHPELGLLPPAKFIEAIEQAGGIAQLTRWALRHALEACAGWRGQGVNVGVAVNISVDDLIGEYLPYYLLELSNRYGLEPRDVTLEVTESAIMHNIDTSLAIIASLRELGFRVAIDDFGTGQSAMAQLKRIPLDELKIDKSFVGHMDNPGDEAIVRSAIDLAHEFGLRVVAEGVKDGQALARLGTLGCECAQGFFVAQPMRAGEFPAWVGRWSSRQGPDIVAIVTAERAVRQGGTRS